MPSLNLFQLAARGVNNVTAPTHLLPDEVISAENAEIVPVDGEGGIEQRVGMTRLNGTALSGEIVTLYNVPADRLTDHTPYLYAGMYTGSTHNWRRSSNGTTWTDVDLAAKPFSNNANIALYAKNYPKAVTLGRKMYYVDGHNPIQLHEFDGTTDAIVSTIPPAVSGTVLTTPSTPVLTFEGYNPASTTYTYKVVAKSATFTSAASTAVTTTTGPTGLNGASDYMGLTLSSPVPGATSYDVYRTAGGATQGKIGVVPIVAGAFTFGNGGGTSGAPLATPAAPVLTAAGTPGATTYSYKVVAKYGSNHGAASSAGSYATGSGTMGGGSGGTIWLIMNTGGLGSPAAGADSYDVYRTVGGTSQGYVGNIPIVAGAFTTGNGHPAGNPYIFADDGIVAGAAAPSTGSGFGPAPPTFHFSDTNQTGDGATAPASASGAAAGNALAVFDLIGDGTSLYFAVLDMAGADPVSYGRILRYFPNTSSWLQVGPNFPTSTGNGSPGTLVAQEGSMNYWTYAGITTGNNTYGTSSGYPLPAGGMGDVKAVSQPATSAVSFNGEMYIGLTFLNSSAAQIFKRTPLGVWSSVLTAPGSGINANGFTSMGVFNGIMFAGWTAGGGGANALIYSTLDGANWVTEITLDPAEVPCQMVTLNGVLYVVLGRTGIGYNSKSRILSRSAAGTWTTVDNPTDDFAGCLGVVYI